MKKLHHHSRAALKLIRERVTEQDKVVFVSGNFNIVHPGHLRLLRFAAECGDFLVVGVNDDDSEGTILPADLRLEGVRSTSWVDYAFTLHDQPEEFVASLKPAIVAKGKEHENMFNPELEIVKSYGGKLLFSSGDLTFSSINLLTNELNRLNFSAINKPQDFPRRHGFSMSDLQSSLQKLQKLKVVVIGDTIMDEYITCDPIGMSQEDPTIVVTPIHREFFLGGAGIVAAHASGLGAKVHFFSVIGDDPSAATAREKLQESGADVHLYIDESRPTTTKQRYRVQGKTLLRVNHLRHHFISKEMQEAILQGIDEIIDRIDLLIFSDFNYGCLPQELVDGISSKCHSKRIMMVADSQSSSQTGDVSRFKNMSLLTPTEREARLAVRDFNSGLVVVAEQLRESARARNLFMTLGAEGVLIHAELSEKNRWLTDKLPALNSAPKDISGAGDSFLTAVSMAMASGSDVWQSAYLGSLAAACQVGRVGNIPLTTKDIELELSTVNVTC